MAIKRDLVLIVGGRLAAASMALVTIHAITTYLTPERYGELALLLSVQMFCGLFLINPVGQHINLNTHAWWDDGTLMPRLKWYIAYVFFVCLVGGIASLFITYEQPADKIFWTSVAVFFMVGAGTWNATLVPMLNMLGFRGAAVFWSIVTIAVGLASSIFLVNWNRSANAWLIGQAIGMIVGAIGAGFVLRKHTSAAKSEHAVLPLLDKKTLIAYCLPLCVATGLMWLQNSGFRFLVQGYWGFAQLGFLAIGLHIAAQMWALAEQLAMQFLYPLFYRGVNMARNETEIGSAFSDLLNTLVPIYMVFTGALIFGSEYILRVLVAPQYHGAFLFVIIGVCIEFFRVVGNLLGNAAHVKRRTALLALPYGAGAAVSFALIYLAAVRGQVIAWAGAALITGGMMTLIVMWAGMRRHLRFTVDVRRWIIGGAVMVSMAATTGVLPAADSFTIAAVILSAVAGVAGIATLGLLWNNPAMIRLFNIELRTKKW
jgi:O-antigen/teichoic acid export membrane protein